MAAHRHWRIYITVGFLTEFVTIAEIELRASVGGADETGSGTASASSFFSGQPASNAFDNSASTSWTSANQSKPQWIAYDFGPGNAKDIREITIQALSGFTSRAPKDFELQASDDGSTWTTVYSIVNLSAWSTSPRAFETPGEVQGTFPSTDFSEYPEWYKPHDWTLSGSGTASFGVRAKANTTGGKVAELVGNSSGSRYLEWNVGSLLHPHLRLRTRVNDVLGRPVLSAYAGGVWWALFPVNGGFRLYRNSTVIHSFGATFAANIWHFFELRLSATKVEYRIYQDGASVPAWLTHTPTDPEVSLSAGGVVGLGANNVAASTYDFDTFEVLDYAAPPPPTSKPDTPTLTATPDAGFVLLQGSPYSHPEGKPHAATEIDFAGTVIKLGPVTSHIVDGLDPETLYGPIRIRYKAEED